MPDDGLPRPIDLTALPRSFWEAMGAGVFSDLSAGDRLQITCPSDPTAIRELLEAILPGRFDWEVVSAGPAGWCVRITRRPARGGSARCGEWTRGRARARGGLLQVDPAA